VSLKNKTAKRFTYRRLCPAHPPGCGVARRAARAAAPAAQTGDARVSAACSALSNAKTPLSETTFLELSRVRKRPQTALKPSAEPLCCEADLSEVEIRRRRGGRGY